MTARYVTFLKSECRIKSEDYYENYWECNSELPETITVFEPDNETAPIGIFDQNGNEYHRLIQREPMGFHIRRSGTQ